MDSQFKINPIKAIVSLSLTVVLFFSSVILGFIFASKASWILIAFLFLALIFLALSFIAYRIYSGVYFVAVNSETLTLSNSIRKTEIALSDIEKLDYIKGKSPFKGDDVLAVEYKKDGKIAKINFLLFYLKDSGDKIYSSVISELEKIA